MNWKARRSAAPYVLLGGIAALWLTVAVARGDQATMCDPRPVESNLPGAPCAVTEADMLRDQLRRERINHKVIVRDLKRANRNLRAVNKPTVDHAIRLAAAVTGASYPAMIGLFTCESTLNPNAVGGGGLYMGLGQFDTGTWGGTSLGRAGFPRTDPYAMAFATVELYDRRGRQPWPVCGRSLR